MVLNRANGARIGWLLIPEQPTVEIWSARLAALTAHRPAQWFEADDLFPQRGTEPRPANGG